MLKKGEISEKDYNAKLETIEKELERCANGNQSQSTTISEPKISGKNIYCTQEAKLCSDGSYVGRTGPNCEFAECPGKGAGSGSAINSFGSAYWQCYDGKESKDSSSCKVTFLVLSKLAA